jgi:hypothetical protein
MDLSDRVEQLEADALKAEAEVARLRMLMATGSNSAVTAAEFRQARDSFHDTFADAQRRRARANAQGKLLTTVKLWIEALPANTRLVLVHAASNGASLESTRNELKELREELRTLQGYPPAAPDIESKVRAYVSELARAALPQVRNYAASQGGLDVRWPSSLDAFRSPNQSAGYVSDRANVLLMFAALDPAELGELIIRAIVKEQPLSQLEHRERVEQLTSRITELSYIECALVERVNGEHSVDAAPMCILGVRIGETEAGEAAA